MSTAILGFFGPYRFLSNFFPAVIEFDGLAFPSVEHAYVAAKTHDRDLREIISQVGTPGAVKSMGRNLPLRPDWEEVKVDFMMMFVAQKFEKGELRNMLIATGDAYLEETNHWGDTFWGVCQGKGQNMLGKILMDVRDIVRTM